METAHLIFQVLNIHAPDEVAGWTNDIQLDLTREPPGYTTWAGNYFDNVTVVTWAVDVAVQLKDTANETLLMLDAGGQVSRSNVSTFQRSTLDACRSTSSADFDRIWGLVYTVRNFVPFRIVSSTLPLLYEEATYPSSGLRTAKPPLFSTWVAETMNTER